MKRILFSIALLLVCLPAFAQQPPPSTYDPQIVSFRGVPSGPCQIYQLGFNELTATYYACQISNHTWTVIGSGGSLSFGSVTSGTNALAAMVVGSGASLGHTGNGTIDATSVTDCTSTVRGGVPTPPNDPLQALLGNCTWGSPPAPALPALYVSDNCGVLTNCVAIQNDFQVAYLCTWANGSAVITCPSGTFVSGDAGKLAFSTNFQGAYTGMTSIYQCGSAGTTTIMTFTDSAHVTLSANCTGTNSSSANNYPFFWGHSDNTAMGTASTTLGSQCGTLVLPGLNAQHTGPSFIGISSAKFITLATNCNAPLAIESLRTGIAVEGQGENVSHILMLPGFDATTCTGGYGQACFGIPLNNSIPGGTGGILFSSWTLTGGGVSNPTGTWTNKKLVEIGSNSVLRDFYCTGFGGNASPLIGLNIPVFGSPVALYNVQMDACGYNTLSNGGSFTSISAGSYFGDSKGAIICNAGGVIQSTGNIYAVNDGASSDSCPSTAMAYQGCAVRITSGTFISVDDIYNAYVPSDHLETICQDGGDVQIDHGDLNLAVGANNNSTTIYLHGGTFHLRNTNATNNQTGAAGLSVLQDGGKFFDEGGNTFASGGSAIYSLTGGNWFGSLSVTGTALATGNIALTSGWDTSTKSLIAGDSRLGTFKVTAAGTPGAGPVITVTFPVRFAQAPICTITQTAGTFGTLTNPAIVITATTATVTWAGTPVAAQTYTFALNCQ